MQSEERISHLTKLIREKKMVDSPIVNKIEPQIRTGVQYALPPRMREQLKPVMREEK